MNIPELNQNKSIKTFHQLDDLCSFDITHPETRKAWEESRRYSHDISSRHETRRWLSMLGMSGCGKTMLAKAIRKCVSVNRPGMTSAFFRWSTVVNRYLAHSDDGIIDYLIRDIDLLIIDDIEADPNINKHVSRLCELADGRLGKWTIFTSNLSLEQISLQINPQISSRMIRGDSVVVQLFNCADWNLQKYKETQSHE